MSGQLQALLALTAALGLHLGAFALTGQQAGGAAQAAGEQGDAALSLQAADGALAELVASWSAPPVVAAAAPAAPAPLPEAAAEPPSPEIASPAPDAPAMPARPMPAPPMADAAPVVAPSLPEPPPAKPEPPLAKPEPAPAKVAKTKAPKAKPAGKPKAAEKPAAESRKAQKAAGSGNGPEAGNGAAGGAGGLSKETLASLKQTWGAAISNRIERRKAYPAAANGASGTVTLRLTVARSGALQGVQVLKSSGNAALDAAAAKAAKSAGRFPAAPKGLDEASYTFRLPLRFVP